jgi:GNAT superfamily N-acetyltransferase
LVSEYLRFESLDRRHDRESFSCREPALDEYLKKYARANAARNVVVVRVLADSRSNRIIGYYSLVAGSVQLMDLPESVARRLPRYDVPVILLARLAVDVEYKGRSYGEALLIDALKRAVEASDLIGAFAVIVDAKHDQARSFYERYNFVRLPGDAYRLFLETDSIRQAFDSA